MKTLRRYRTSLGAFMTALVALWQICSPMNLSAATHTWNQTGAGPFTWNTSGNWTGGVPGNLSGDVVNLTANLTAAQIINLDVNATTGTLNIGDPTTAFFGYTLQTLNNSTLTFDNGLSAAVLSKAAAATANDLISVNIMLASAGNANFNITNAVANTTSLLTLSGNISESGGAKNLVIAGNAAASSNGVTVLTGNNSFTGTVSINSGTLRAIGTGALNSGSVNSITIGSGATLDLRADGNNTGSIENIAFGDDVTMAGSSTILVSNSTTALTTALNKTIQLGALNTGGANTLTVTPSNGYGLEFTGLTTLGGNSVFSVGGTQASNVVQGLTLSGKVTGNFTLTKTGTGTMVLANTSGVTPNDFTGNISVTGGILAFAADSSLGNSANTITVNGTTSGIRALNDISTARTISFANATTANNILEVVENKTLSLITTANSITAANGFVKNNNGTLDITTAQNFAGAVTVNAGVIKVSNATALGTTAGTTTIANNVGAAVHLNGINTSENFTLNSSGIDAGGALRGISGANIASGTIALGAATTIGVDTGATLSLTSGTAIAGAFALTLTGGGDGTITSNMSAPTSLIKLGTGTWDLQGIFSNTGAVNVSNGTLKLSGANGAISASTAITLQHGATLQLDNSGVVGNNNLNRVNNAATISLQGGNLIFTGNANATSSESLGAITANRGASAITINAGLGQQANLTLASLARGTGGQSGTLVFSAAGLNSAPAVGADIGTITLTAAPTFVGQTGAAGTVNKGILSWALAFNQTDSSYTFATQTAAGGFVRQLAASEQVTSMATATTNFLATTSLPSNINLTAADTLDRAITANSLNLGSSGGLTIGNNSVLTLSSGGILATTGNAGITGGVISVGALDAIIHAQSDLTISSRLTGSGGLTKGGSGNLTLTGKAYVTGNTILGAGTLTLGATGDHTLYPGQNLIINPGATLDLNGKAQTVAIFFSDPLTSGAGTGAAATSAVVTGNSSSTFVFNQDNNTRNFFGTFQGGMTFARTGQSTTNLYGNSTTTGDAYFLGGTTALIDQGALANINSINIHNATFTLNNTGAANNNDRVNNSADINMRGGAMVYLGRNQTASSETFGALNLLAGSNNFVITEGTVGVSSADLIFASVAQSNGATVNFQDMDGLIGNAGRITFTDPSGLGIVNGIIPWATRGGAELIAYNSSFGLGALNAAGFAGYTGATVPLASNAAGNYADSSAAITLAAGGLNLNSLKLSPGVNQVVSFSSGTDVLNLTAGTMLKTGNFTTSIGATPNSGRLTAGGTASSGTKDLYLFTTSTSNTTINSAIIDNPNGALVRLVYTPYFSGQLVLAGTNTNSGGTIVNGGAAFVGGALNLAATGTLGGGGLTLNHAAFTQTAGGIITSQSVTLNGGSTLTLAGNNTLTSLIFNNTGGGNTAPTAAIGSGILTLSDATAIVADSQNVGSTSIISGAGSIALGASTKTFDIRAILLNSDNVGPLQPTLAISANLTGTAGINKIGNGILQLSSTASTFSGGVTLSAGGLDINANSSITAAAVPGAIEPSLLGPLGRGVLTIEDGTFLMTSTNNTTVRNDYTVNGDFSFRGINNLVLNGFGTLASGSHTITVDAPQMTATLGGIIGQSGAASITKAGNGTLVLGNLNTFTGGVTVDSGTLRIQAPASGGSTGITAGGGAIISSISPVGTGGITYNGGLLDIRGGGSVGGAIVNIGNNLTINAALTQANINVDPTNTTTAAGTSNIITMGTLTSQTTTQINITGTASQSPFLRFTDTNLDLSAGPANFNVANGVTLILGGGGFNAVNRPTNSGAGNILFTGNNTFTASNIAAAATQTFIPTVNASTTPQGTGTITMAAGSTAIFRPVMDPGTALSTAGYVIGGGALQKTFHYTGTARTLADAGAAGNFSNAQLSGMTPHDAAMRNFAPTLGVQSVTGTVSHIATYQALLNITTGGVYTFGGGADDQIQIVVDGTPLISALTGGTGLDSKPYASMNLTAGQHLITVKFQDGNAGGFQLFYGGPDTGSSGITGGTVPNLVAIPKSALSYTTSNSTNMALLNNAFSIDAAATATWDGQGTDFNTGVDSLTLNNGSTLIVNNTATGGAFGLGVIGVAGMTTVSGGVATVSPNTGALGLFGGITDGGNGLNKAGTGILILDGDNRTGSTFTGAFNATGGFVQLANAKALTTGTTTINGAVLDLNGLSNVEGTLQLNGAGPTGASTTLLLSGALYNSSATAASLATTATVNFATATTISGYGDIEIKGVVSDSAAAGFTKRGPNTLTLSGNNTYTGVTTVTNGLLKLAHINALGTTAGGTTVGAGATLDLNGLTIGAEAVTMNGAGIIGLANANTLAALINGNTSSAATLSGALTLAGNSSIGNATLSSMLPAGITTAGATAQNGDITLSGAITGAFQLTKTGTNTLFVTGAAAGNTVNGFTLNYGSIVFNGSGSLSAASNNAVTVQTGATLFLDNSGTPISQRLGGRGMFLNGTYVIAGNATGVTESISTGTNNFNLSAGSVLRLNSNGGTGGVIVEVSNANTSVFTRNQGGTLLMQGLTNTAAGGIFRGVGTSLFTSGNIIGQQSSATASATPTINTLNKAIIPFLIVDSSVSGTGTSFATTDLTSTTGALRSLAVGEMLTNALPTTLTKTAVWTSATTFTVADTTGLAIGQSVMGTGIAMGATNIITGIVGNTVTIAGTTAVSSNTTNLQFSAASAGGTTSGVANVNFTGATSLTAGANASTYINSLTMAGTSNLTVNSGSALILASGGVLAVGTNTITGSGVLQGEFTGGNAFAPTTTRELIFHVTGANSLSVDPVIFGMSGLTKAGNGTMTLNAQNSYIGQTTINGGTLELNGGSNTIFVPWSTPPAPGNSASGIAAQIFQINSGGKLDLNGNLQSVINFNSLGTLPGTGGEVINSNATAGTFRIGQQANQTWAGNIGGVAAGTRNLNFQRDGNNTFTVVSANQYTGTTLITGGATRLIDLGTFENTSAVTINRSALIWDDTGIQSVSNRLPNVPLTLNGGALVYNTRPGVNSNYTLGGGITLGQGNSNIQIIPSGSGGAGEVSLTITNGPSTWTRATGATLTFSGGTPGDNPYIRFGSAPTLTNGIIAPWLTISNPTNADGVNGNLGVSLATYDPSYGVRPLTSYVTGSTAVFSSGGSDKNVIMTGNVAMLAGNQSVNSLLINNATLDFASDTSTDVLTITSGALLAGNVNNGKNIGSADNEGRITAGVGQSEFFIYNAQNNLIINSGIIDNGAPLHVSFNGYSQGGGTIYLDGQNTYTGDTFVNGIAVQFRNFANQINGDLYISGGNNNGTDSLGIGQGTVTYNFNNAIADTSDVIINGGGRLNLNGFSDTIATLTFNNDGGSSAADGPNVLVGAGTLAVTGLIKSQNNVNGFQVPSISGNLNLLDTSSVNSNATVQVDAHQTMPGQIGLSINADITTPGNIGFTKTGAGVLGIGGQSADFGTLSVSAGGLAFGAANAIIGGRVDLANNTFFDTRNFSGTIGSITGTSSSVIQNYSQTAGTATTLTIGFDNTNATFDGTISSPFVTNRLNITKLGSGTQTFTGNSSGSDSGIFAVNNGAITVSGAAGRLAFTTYQLNTGGIINVDNSTNNVVNRLGGASLSTAAASSSASVYAPPMRVMTLQGGTINFTAGTSAASEALGDVTIGAGTSTFNLTPGTGGYTVTMNRLIGNSGLLTLNAGANGLGTAAAGSGVVNVKIDNVTVAGAGGTGAAISGLGVANIGLVGGNIAGVGIRSDVVGIDSSGSGFVTYDIHGFRLLTDLEYGVFPNQPINPLVGQPTTGWAAQVPAILPNALVNTTTYTTVSTTVASLRLDSGGSIVASGGTLAGFTSPAITPVSSMQEWNGAGAFNTLSLSSGIILANAGNNGIQGGAITSSVGTAAITFNTIGDLDVNAWIIGGAGNSIVKNFSGTLNINRPTVVGNATTINAGTVNLNSGRDNTLYVTVGAATPTYYGIVSNGGTLDLNGKSQGIASLASLDTTPGGGGIITNSSGTASRLLVSSGTSTTFSGNVNGNLSLYKMGTSTQTLSSTNAYTGATNILGGTLRLVDSGALTATSAININGGVLQLDNTGLSNSLTRIPNVAVVMEAGQFRVDARQGTTDSMTVNLTLNRGQNTIAINPPSGSGSFDLNTTATASSFVSNFATVNFTRASGEYGSTGTPPRFIFGALPALSNKMFGGWATINGDQFAFYVNQTNGIQVPNNNGAGNYDGNPTGTITTLTPTTAENYNTNDQSIVDISTGIWNSLRQSGGSNDSITAKGLDQLITINTGGVLMTNTGGGSTIRGGRWTGGTANLNSAINSGGVLYLHTNANTSFEGQIIDNGYTSTDVVKGLGSTLVFGARPISRINATTTGNALIDVYSGGAARLAIGSIISGAPAGMANNSVVTSINSATQFGVSANSTAGTGTDADFAILMPTTTVLTGRTLTSGVNTVTVPAGTIVYAGQVVTTSVGAVGALGAGTTTVLSVSGTTVTLSQNALTTGAATLLFAPIANQTTTATSTVTANSTTVTFAGVGVGAVVGQSISGAGIPVGAYITAVTSPNSVTISAPATVTGVGNVAVTLTAPTAQSLITSTESGSTTARVMSTTGMFVGQSLVGNNLAAGTTITAIDGVNKTVTLSAAATGSSTQNVLYSIAPVGRTAVGATNTTTTVTVGSTAGLSAGMSVFGSGIPLGATIASITNGTTLVLSVAATSTLAQNSLTFSAPLENLSVAAAGSTASNSTTLTLGAPNTSIGVGMLVRGPGIQNNTVVTAISGTTVTLSTATVTTAGTNASNAGAGTFAFYTPSTYSNAYTGDTIVNAGTLQLGSANHQLGAVQIQGNLIVNNGGTVTMNTNNGQIASTSNVTINGGGVLTLTGVNTLNSVTFNNNGGTATPTVTPTGTLFLTNGTVNVSSDNAASTATFGAGTLLFGSAPIFNVTTNTPERLATDLLINSVISNTNVAAAFGTTATNGWKTTDAALTKNGNGTISFGGANTFSNGVNLNAGTLVLSGATNTVSNGTITSSQLGTGALSIAGGTTVLSDNNRTISNIVNVNGNFTIGGTLGTNSSTFNGMVNLGGTNRTIEVTYYNVTGTLNGGINGTAGLTKAGNGTLSISGANYTGDTIVNGGRLAVANANGLSYASRVVLANNTELDLNNSDATIGSLSGTGLVTNSGAAGRTLRMGVDNTNQSFGGVITNAAQVLNFTKLGTGTQTLTNTNTYTGATVVNRGGLTLSGNGTIALHSSTALTAGGAITLDNSGTNVANRLGGNTKAFGMNGGTLNIIGSASGALNEQLGAVTLGATLNGGLNTINITPGSGGVNNLSLLSYTSTANSGSTLFINGTGLGLTAPAASVANVTVVGPAPAVTGSASGIIANATGTDGTNSGFLTYSANGFRVVTAADLSVFPTQPTLPTQTGVTLGLTSANTTTNNVAVSTAVNMTQSTTVNSLTLNSGGGITSVGGNQVTVAGAAIPTAGNLYTAAGVQNTLTVTSGGIYAASGNTGITNGYLTAGANQLIFHTPGNLTVNSYLTGTGGLVKDGAGTLTLGKSYLMPVAGTARIWVNEGTLVLDSGIANTILVQTSNAVGVNVQLALAGGTLDLNGKDQAFSTIDSVGQFAQSSTITSSAAANLHSAAVGAGSIFNGVIGGALNYYKASSGAATVTLSGANTYTGTTNVLSNTLTLVDAGTILNTSEININGGTLVLDNTGLADISQRISSSVIIDLNAGGLTLTGRRGLDSVSSIGTTNALMGTNTLTATATQNNQAGSATLTVGNLVRSTGATVVFAGTNLGTAATASNGGTGAVPNIMLTQVNGLAPSLTNGILGGWATVGDNWATYNQNGAGTANTFGVQAVAAAAYTTVDATTTTIASTANVNIAPAAAVTLNAGLPATNAINSLRIANSAAGSIDLSGKTFQIGTGGILRTNTAFASGLTNGTITTGGAGDLIFTVNSPLANLLTIGAVISNNGGTNIVKAGTGGMTFAQSSNNTYVGTAYVNAGTLNLGAATGITAITGDLVVNNGGTVAHTTNFVGQIASTSNVTINGGGSLSFAGLTGTQTQTLASVTFNNNGGTATPTLTVLGTATTSVLTLSGATAITANSYNVGTVNTITGTGLLNFSTAGATIQVTSNDAAGAYMYKATPDLNINAIIAGTVTTQLNKTGNGIMALSQANQNTGGWKIWDGTVVIDNNTGFGTVAGTITIGDSVTAPTQAITVYAGTAARTVGANPISMFRNLTFGGTASTNNLTFGGTVALNGADRTFTVTNPNVTATLNGIIDETSGTAGITKAGNGILVLGGANTYNGATVISSGLLRLGAAGVIPDDSDVSIASAGALDMTGRSEAIASLGGNGLVTNSGAAATLTIGNSVPTNTVFSGVITQGATAGSMALTKTGTSLQTLSGANTYNGATAINGGGLIVNGTLANTAVTVAAGGTLGGNGTIGNILGGSVTATTGTSAINLSTPTNGTTSATGGTVADISTLSISGVSGSNVLTIGNGATLTFDASNNATDMIALLNGGKLSQTGTAFNIVMNQLSATTLLNGVYNLITFSAGDSNLTNTGNTLTATEGTLDATFTLNGWRLFASSTALQLIKGDNFFYWNGDVSNAWNVAGANTNWSSDSAGTIDPGLIPGATDTVIFASDTGASMATTLGANFSINALQFGAGNNNTTGTTPASASIDTGNFTLTLNAGGITQASGSLSNSIGATGSGGISLLATQAWANNSANHLTVTAPVSGAGGLVINGSGLGKVILGSATANTYTGGTTIAGPAVGTTLQLAAGSSNALGAVTNALAVNLGTLDLNGNSVTVGSLSGTGTSANSIITNTAAATTSTLTIDQSVNTAYSGAITNTGTGLVSLVKNGTGNFSLTGTAGNTYTGGTYINAGTLTVGNGVGANESALAFGTYASGTPDVNTVFVNSGATVAFNQGNLAPTTSFQNSFNFNGGTMFVGVNGGRTVIGSGTNAKITIGAGGATFIGGNGGGDDITLAGVLTGSGTINVNNTGGSWVIINNANGGSTAGATYTGTVNIGTGAVTLGNNTALAGASVVIGAGASGGALNFNSGINNAILGSLAGSVGFSLTTTGTATAVNLTVGGNNNSTTFTGIIAPGSVAGGKIIKTGTGSFAMNNANTFTGGVTVSNGTVTTNNALGFGSTGTAILTFGDANSLAGNNATTAYITGAVNVANPIVVNAASIAGTGTATIGSLGANGIFSGGITMNKDLTVTATAGNTVTLQTGAITRGIAGTSTLNFTGPGNGTIASAITGSAANIVALTVNNTNPGATLLVSGANTYFGATTVTAGNLTAGAATGFSANSAYTLANSSLAVMTTGNFATTVGALSGGGALGGNVVISANAAAGITVGALDTDTTYSGAMTTGLATGAGLVKTTTANTTTGSGSSLTLTGNNTYLSNTTVNSGILTVGSTGQISGGGAVTVSSSATKAGSLNVNGYVGSAVTVTGTDATHKGVLSGTGTVSNVGQTVSINGLGLLRPGGVSTGLAGLANGQLTVGGNLTFAGGPGGGAAELGLTAPTMQDSTIQTQLDLGISTYETYMLTQLSAINSAPTGNHDAFNVVGTLTLASGTTGGVIRLQDNGYLSSAAVGDIFDVMDWGSLNLNSFNTGGSRYVTGGTAGDLDLATLSGGLLWDLGAFTTHGVIVVVPEPSRMLLLMFGLMALFFRRRRSGLSNL